MKEIDDVFAGFLCGESLDDEERAVVNEWKERSPGNSAFEEDIRRLHAQRVELKERAGEEVAFRRVENAVRHKRRRRNLLRAGSVAAGIVLVVGWMLLSPPVAEEVERLPPVAAITIQPGKPAAELLLPDGQARWLTPGTVILADSTREIKTTDRALVYSGAATGKQEFHTLSIPAGGEYDLLLPDGTMVYLNAGSTLRYPNFFTGDYREVILAGEGYFEVARDAAHPFIVRAGDLTARVLGTSFNINAYPEREVIMTTLVEGRVRVECGGSARDVLPGTQVVYDKTTGESTTRVVDVEMYTSWKDGYYIFENTPLEEFMATLARWYDLRVAYRDEQVKGIKFSGSLKRYDNIVPLLKKLEYTRDVEFIIEENLVTIQKK
jgi:ferric-dicitrate binding protein FerR (iron transport regulator)